MILVEKMDKPEVKLEKYEHVHFRFNTRVVNPKSVMASVLRLTPSKTWNYDQFVYLFSKWRCRESFVLLNCHLTQLVTYTSKSIGDRYSHLAKSSKQAHFLRLFEKK